MRSLGAKIKKDPRLEKLLHDVRRAQVDLQLLQAQGKTPGQDQVERLQKLVKQAEGQTLLVEYLSAEQAYGQILSEVQNVLTEAFVPDVPGALRAK